MFACLHVRASQYLLEFYRKERRDFILTKLDHSQNRVEGPNLNAASVLLSVNRSFTRNNTASPDVNKHTVVNISYDSTSIQSRSLTAMSSYQEGSRELSEAEGRCKEVFVTKFRKKNAKYTEY